MFVKLRDGLRLHAQIRGGGEPLLLLHGFTGSLEFWGEEILEGLARDHEVTALDLLGHGRSDTAPDPQRFGMEEILHDLREVLDAVGIASATWVGYSMGGRIALAGAVLNPERVQRLVLESASPGLATGEERRARRRADEALAQGILLGGMEAFVDQWMGLPLFATQGKLSPGTREAARERRLQNRPEALATCLRGLGTGAQPSFWGSLEEIRVPALLLAGEEDAKFTGIAREMAGRIPGATLRVIPRAGHTIHLENPLHWLAEVRTFLRGGG